MRPYDVLSRILSIWPSEENKASWTTFTEKAQSYLARDFNFEAALRARGQLRIAGEGFVDCHAPYSPDEARFVVVDERSDIPSRATLILNDGEWRLRELGFQCPSCFGSSVLGGLPCENCGATGFGIRECRIASKEVTSEV